MINPSVVDGHFFGSRVAPCAVAAMIDVVHLSDLLSWTLDDPGQVTLSSQNHHAAYAAVHSTTGTIFPCLCQGEHLQAVYQPIIWEWLEEGMPGKHFQPLPDDWWINITTLLYQCFQQTSTIYLSGICETLPTNNLDSSGIMLENNAINHPQITMFIGGINLPFPVMGGLLFYPHYNQYQSISTNHYQLAYKYIYTLCNYVWYGNGITQQQ